MSTLRPALRKGLSIFLLLTFSAGLAAATVQDLYETRVPTAGEDLASRNQAIADALALVMVKLTGRDPAPGVAELAPQAAGFVQQFRFERVMGPEGQADSRLWVRFDKTGLDRAMRQRGLPLWGDSRPGVLVWLAAEQGGARELVSPEMPLAKALRDAADARGLPVQWPLLDLEDQSRLSAADVWSDYSEGIEQASSRYNQPLVLAGRLRQVAADHWEARWSLYRQDRPQEDFTTTGEHAAQALQAAVSRLTDQLVARYAPLGTGGDGPGHLVVRVEDVRSVADYARVLALLGDREAVDRVWLRASEGDALELTVLSRGGRDALARVLDLAGPLERLPDLPSPPPAPSPDQLPAAPLPAPGTSDTPPPADGTPAAAPQPPTAVAPPERVDLRYRLVR